MAWPKLKNTIILIFLAANVLLSTVALPLWSRHEQEERQLGQKLEQLFADRGIRLDASILPQEQTLGSLELDHGDNAASAAVTALLGQVVLVQNDSSQYLSTYSGPGGSCIFSHSGEFSANLTNAPAVSGNLLEASRELLQQMGFDPASLTLAGQDEEGNQLVQATQALYGLPVYGPGLTLTYRDGSLVQIEGCFYLWDAEPTLVSQDQSISAADALVAFLNGRSSLGWVGSAVTGLEQGWIETETPSVSMIRLTPVWRITTDTAVIYVDGLTGALEAG